MPREHHFAAIVRFVELCVVGIRQLFDGGADAQLDAIDPVAQLVLPAIVHGELLGVGRVQRDARRAAERRRERVGHVHDTALESDLRVGASHDGRLVDRVRQRPELQEAVVRAVEGGRTADAGGRFIPSQRSSHDLHVARARLAVRLCTREVHAHGGHTVTDTGAIARERARLPADAHGAGAAPFHREHRIPFVRIAQHPERVGDLVERCLDVWRNGERRILDPDTLYGRVEAWLKCLGDIDVLRVRVPYRCPQNQ